MNFYQSFYTYFLGSLLVFSIICLPIQETNGQDIKSNTKGFSLNLSGVYGSWNSESTFFGDLDDVEPTGFGISFKAAYGINQNIEILAAISSAGFSREFEWNAYQLTTFNFGGRYNFGATLRRFRPFVEVSVSGNSLIIDPITFDGINLYELTSSGVGLSLGGGLHIFLTQNLSINANGKIGFGNFSATALSGSEVNNLEEKLDFTITTVHIGLNYFFH